MGHCSRLHAKLETQYITVQNTVGALVSHQLWSSKHLFLSSKGCVEHPDLSVYLPRGEGKLGHVDIIQSSALLLGSLQQGHSQPCLVEYNIPLKKELSEAIFCQRLWEQRALRISQTLQIYTVWERAYFLS